MSSAQSEFKNLLAAHSELKKESLSDTKGLLQYRSVLISSTKLCFLHVVFVIVKTLEVAAYSNPQQRQRGVG